MGVYSASNIVFSDAYRSWLKKNSVISESKLTGWRSQDIEKQFQESRALGSYLDGLNRRVKQMTAAIASNDAFHSKLAWLKYLAVVYIFWLCPNNRFVVYFRKNWLSITMYCKGRESVRKLLKSASNESKWFANFDNKVYICRSEGRVHIGDQILAFGQHILQLTPTIQCTSNCVKQPHVDPSASTDPVHNNVIFGKMFNRRLLVKIRKIRGNLTENCGII